MMMEVIPFSRRYGFLMNPLEDLKGIPRSPNSCLKEAVIPIRMVPMVRLLETLPRVGVKNVLMPMFPLAANLCNR
jgi:hypothetical protein